MNWGYKIMVVYSVFAIAVLFMAFKLSQEKVDLVTPDYYEKELKYQQQIDAGKRASALSGKIKIEQSGDSLVIQFPKDFSGKKTEGELQLYYPADKNKDLLQKFSTYNNLYKMKIPEQNRGQHTVQVKATVDNLNYYFEENIFL